MCYIWNGEQIYKVQGDSLPANLRNRNRLNIKLKNYLR